MAHLMTSRVEPAHRFQILDSPARSMPLLDIRRNTSTASVRHNLLVRNNGPLAYGFLRLAFLSFVSSQLPAITSRSLPNVSPSPSPTPNSQSDTTCSSISDDEEKREAIALRATCTTPTFNQSTKFSSLVASEGPSNPFMQRGHGICTIPRYTDYKTALEDEGSPPTPGASRSLNRKLSRMGLRTSEDDVFSSAPSSSSSLSRKASRFRLRLRPSKSSLRSSDGSSDGNSRCSSPVTAVSSEKPLPLPPLFSPCTSPFDEYQLDHDRTPVTEVPPPPAPPKPRFKIRRKPVPEYIPEYLPEPPLPAVDFDSLSSSSSVYSSETDSSADECSSLQIVGPNVFIAYNDNSCLSALATAFTHIIHLSTAKPTGRNILRTPRSDVTYDPETGAHTLYLPIPPPAIPPPHIQRLLRHRRVASRYSICLLAP
ncbi:hypothetical protein MSAN_02192700 [Mycena sanguinolenta]|uniref:Uncharacterized protein n=1 Tax=Mycena sanguinolenta TaxID=230812 RepID=A0A8H6XDZ5_9AGAR|nr:hypothetical protein MSAN_02192700 [Mycena sanguinolenta]